MDKLIVIEGYDMTGKSTMVNSLNKRYQRYKPFVAMAKNQLQNIRNADRYHYFTVGCMHYLREYDPNSNQIYIADRFVFSPLVYGDIKKDQRAFTKSQRDILLHIFQEFQDKIEIEYIYLRHNSKNAAYKMHQLAQSRPDNDDMDQSDFEEYWEDYLKADQRYRYYFKYFGIDRKVQYKSTDL